MLYILSVFVDKCKAAGRYGEFNCLFNAKCIFGFLFSLNILTVLELTLRSEYSVALIPHDRTTFIIIGLSFTAIVYVILTLKYPGKKILAVTLTKKSKTQIFIGFICYVTLSLLAFLFALLSS